MNIANNFKRVLTALAGTLALTSNSAPITDAQLDDIIKKPHNIISYFANPEPDRGNITGIAGNNLDKYVLTWSNGDVGVYNEGSQVASHYFATIPGSQGISFVTPGAGIQGDIAVARSSGFSTYDWQGNPVADYGVQTGSTIRDIKVDLTATWLATDSGYYRRSTDGTLTKIASGGVNSLLPIDLETGLNDRIGVASGGTVTFAKLDSSLNLVPNSGVGTDYLTVQGVGLTQNRLMGVVGDVVYEWNNPFRNLLNQSPPESPALSIEKQGNDLKLSYTGNPGYSLQTATDLSQPNWTDAPTVWASNGNQFETTLKPIAKAMFFRLKK